MLDYTNAFACLALLVLLAPVAKSFYHSHYFGQRIAFAVVVIVLGLQIAAPLFDFDGLPEANFLQVVFNLVMLIVVLASRREIMKLVRESVVAPIAEGHPLRRATDIEDASQLAGVRGRGRE